jgi:hypothetical protein
VSTRRVDFLSLLSCSDLIHSLLKRNMLRVDLKYEIIENKGIVVMCRHEKALSWFWSSSIQPQIADFHCFDANLKVKTVYLCLQLITH